MKQLYKRIFILFIILGMINLANSVTNGQKISIDASPLIVYQVADPITVYQTEQFNLSISVTNIYFEDFYNVSLKIIVPSQIEFLNSSKTGTEFNNETDEILYHIGNLSVSYNFQLTIIYNVTSDNIETLVLPEVEVTFYFENGISGSIKSSSNIEISFRGKKITTTTTSLRPIPTGTIDPPPFIELLIFIIPLAAFTFVVFALRKLKL
ncbi:hypothetical protein [Candidatus Hodarchaeum mangrovi]